MRDRDWKVGPNWITSNKNIRGQECCWKVEKHTKTKINQLRILWVSESFQSAVEMNAPFGQWIQSLHLYSRCDGGKKQQQDGDIMNVIRHVLVVPFPLATVKMWNWIKLISSLSDINVAFRPKHIAESNTLSTEENHGIVPKTVSNGRLLPCANMRRPLVTDKQNPFVFVYFSSSIFLARVIVYGGVLSMYHHQS